MITKCRICDNTKLISVVNLGEQKLTGVFPKDINIPITSGPLSIVKCDESNNGCGLVQLSHSYDLEEMYGENYGYRSGLNVSMVNHLKDIHKLIEGQNILNDDDIILDIGSNDGTLLNMFDPKKYNLVGIDPTASKFKEYYSTNINVIPKFFSKNIFTEYYDKQKAKIITSIAMFYDLDSPLTFMKEVYDILDQDGIWIIEHSYLPMMLNFLTYDTICHEHIEYYRMKQIKWMADRVGFNIAFATNNYINGGSIMIILHKNKSDDFYVNKFLNIEIINKLDTINPYKVFANNVLNHKKTLINLIKQLNYNHKTVCGLGASTKGNVILQYCGFTKDDIKCIAEVNKDKFGHFTPGTNIPILSEEEVFKMNPDYLLVMPYHFKDGIVKNNSVYLKNGGAFIFPLPNKISLVTWRKNDNYLAS